MLGRKTIILHMSSYNTSIVFVHDVTQSNSIELGRLGNYSIEGETQDNYVLPLCSGLYNNFACNSPIFP